MTKSRIDRFMAKVSPEPNSGCWLWLASAQKGDYGHIWDGQAVVAAHLWSYRYHKGEIPKGFQIDHICRVTLCVNPDHLEAVTPSVNIQRSAVPILTGMINSGKTYCPRGHAYTPENTYYYKNRKHRQCKTCNRESHREKKAKVEILYGLPRL